MWKAIIMAGGEGTRLRPLTCSLPKPMVPFLGRPVMGWAVALLRAHGVRETGVTLRYLPESVMERFGDESDGVSFHYFVEKEPLGTAGSVKSAAGFLDEPFLVVSGDALTDMDLTAAMRFHQERGALATLVLRREPCPLEYGVVVADQDGRVQRFIEKPDWGRAISDTVNTGIYLLQPEALRHIPAGRSYDFGRELLPKLVEEGAPVYAYVTSDYWCDIGDPGVYLRAHVDALEGRVRLPLEGKRRGMTLIAPGAEVEGGALIEGACYIGKEARVRAGARLGPHAVLYERARALPGCNVKRTVMWREAEAGEGAVLRGAILMDGARALRASSAYEDAVLGSDSVLGERAVLRPGVKVWPGKRIADGTQVRDHVVWGSGAGMLLGKRGASGDLPDLTPATAALLGGAWAEGAKLHSAAIGHDGSPACAPLCTALEAGLAAAGVRVVRLHRLAAADVRFAVPALTLSGGAYVCLSGGRMCLHLYGESGAPLVSDALRAIESVRRRGDIRPADAANLRTAVDVRDASLFHTASLVRTLGSPRLAEKRFRAALCCPSPLLLERCADLLTAAGIGVRTLCAPRSEACARPDEIGVYLSRDGEGITAFDGSVALERGRWPFAAAVIAAARHGGPAYCAADDGDALEPYCAVRGVPLRRLPLAASDLSSFLLAPGEHYEARLCAYHLRCDGASAALALLSHLAVHTLSLSDFTVGMPHVFLRTLNMPCRNEDKGRVMRAMLERGGAAPASEGVRLRVDGGWIWVIPSSDTAECRITCEGASAEAADELAFTYESLLTRVMKE